MSGILVAAGCGIADGMPRLAAICNAKLLIYCIGGGISTICKPQVAGSIPIAGSTVSTT